MPELPEVETVRLSLSQHIIGRRIIKTIRLRDNLRYQIPASLEALSENQRIISLHRRSKYLILNLENNMSIIIHLGMSGRFTLNSDEAIKKHDHVIFKIEGLNRLVLNDPRRFGLVDIIETPKLNQSKHFKDLGPEPLEEGFNADYLSSIITKRTIPIKNFIMDAKIVVGVGNIYASESLYYASIHPSRPANSLKITEINLLVEAIKVVLNKAIRAGGSTLRDFVSGQGEAGYFQNQFNVYGKAGNNCIKCLTNIEKINHSGRSTFFCSKCQK